MNRRALTRGFTAIEAVIVFAITATAFVALVSLYIRFNALYGFQQAYIAAAGSAGAAMNAFEAAVLPANHVLASHAFGATTYSSAENVLVLELPAIDSSGAVIANTKDYVAFYASSTALYRLIEADPASARSSGLKKYSSSLSVLSFTYDNADFAKVANVTADIQTQALYKKQPVQAHLNERMRLRNLPTSP